MSDPDSGDVEGLPPQEALDTDERLVDDGDTVDAPDSWHGADRFGTTPAEEAAGAPLSARLAEEAPDEAPVEVSERAVADLPLDELDESVDRLDGLDEELNDPIQATPPS